jgi:hypothetical protein
MDYLQKVKTLMVTNSAKINKTNNHLSAKFTQRKKGGPRHMTLEIQDLTWDMQTPPVNEISTISS